MTQTNRDAFLSEYSTLHRAGVGVTLIRTREPFRALEALQSWAAANMPRNPFKAWSMLGGWGTYKQSDPQAAPEYDDDLNVFEAMKKIDGHGKREAFPDGTYVVFWPHFLLPKIPGLIQILAELAVTTSEKIKRVALIVPTEFTLPPELNEAVSILDFDLPNREELREAYNRVVQSVDEDNARPPYEGADVSRILNAVTGMTEMEAENAIARAASKYKDKFPRVSIDVFVAEVMKIKTEVIKRSECLEIMPLETMNDVGGLDALKQWVSERKPAFTQEAREAGVDRPKGFLLVGSPGNGKSLAAKATAHALGLPLIRFDLSKVYGGLVGESEGKVRGALKTIEAMSPAVVMLDELDKAVSKGANGRSSDVSARVLGTLLTFMQETKADLFFVATANRTEDLPSELVRKGRLDEIFAVGMPTEDERRDIVGIHLRKRKEDINAPEIASGLEAILEASKGHVGSEIEAAVKEAKMLAFNQKTPVTAELICAQFGNSKPIAVAFEADFKAMETWAENNARPASGVLRRGNTEPVGTPVPRARRRASVPGATPSATQLDG